jgi:hypothetical protein
MVVVSPDGELRFVYDDDAFNALYEVGSVDVRRASTVEPRKSPLWGVRWVADLAAVGGPKTETISRESALAWEREWLEDNFVPVPR